MCRIIVFIKSSFILPTFFIVLNCSIVASASEFIQPSSVSVITSEADKVFFGDRAIKYSVIITPQLSYERLMNWATHNQKAVLPISTNSISIAQPSPKNQSENREYNVEIFNRIAVFYKRNKDTVHSILYNCALTLIYGFLCGSGILSPKRKNKPD